MGRMKSSDGFSLIECMTAVGFLGVGLALLASMVHWTGNSWLQHRESVSSDPRIKAVAYTLAKEGRPRASHADGEIQIYFCRTPGVWFFRYTHSKERTGDWQGPFFISSNRFASP